MNRQEILLAALASGSREDFSPVQIQKLMFLIDKTIASSLGGPFFAFEPYHYGPFDVAVYNEFAQFEAQQLGHTEGDGRDRRYRLNDEGRERALEILNKLSEPHRRYIAELATLVQSLSFTALVSSVYKAYPEMKANSVFRG